MTEAPHGSRNKRLLLLRHGKSSWEEARLSDHERPLAKRGIRASLGMSRYIREHYGAPELILTSSAVRTRQTVDQVLKELDCAVPVEMDPALYLAEPEQILARIQRLDDPLGHVLLVGHNPGLHLFALRVVSGGDSRAIGRMRQKFPTAALATIGFDGGRWTQVQFGRGILRDYITPKDLALDRQA